ncbi:MAG TPA: 3-hydroxyisobutyrate dehydrogenase [Caulobacteraceae bacterium]|nr:3-hydroxyisobutyrate dehydrogenase [Caulobacteraceae bacterium]
MTQTAFIGLGNMGGGMAANLAKAGVSVRAFDLAAPAVERAVAAGCASAPTAGDAARGADVVITMLPAGAHVRSVLTESVFPNASAGALVIDCSTTDVETAREMAAKARELGFRFADAPVSGGTAGAEGGTLTFMVGCDDQDFAAVEQVLGAMGRAVIRAGGPGTGQAVKICNNMLLGVSMLGVCEALNLADALGLDAERFFEIASKSSGQCWSLTSYCPVPQLVPAAPSNRNFEGGFSTAMMLKDLKLAQSAAANSRVATPMGAQAEALYALFERLGYGGKDFSAAIKLLGGSLAELT